jgi:hypothetical protein
MANFNLKRIRYAIHLLDLPKNGHFTEDDVEASYTKKQDGHKEQIDGASHLSFEFAKARTELIDWINADKPGIARLNQSVVENKTAPPKPLSEKLKEQEETSEETDSETDIDYYADFHQRIKYKKPLFIFYCSWFGLMLVLAIIVVVVFKNEVPTPLAGLFLISITAMATWYSLKAIYVQVRRSLIKKEKDRFFWYTVLPMSLLVTIASIPEYNALTTGGLFIKALGMFIMAILFFSISTLPLIGFSNLLFNNLIIFNESRSNNKNKWWHDRNFRVASHFWTDGLLRIVFYSFLIWLIHATIQTDSWTYSPFMKEKAESISICWPVHEFKGEGKYADYHGKLSYPDGDKLPPDLRQGYEGVYKNIEEQLLRKDGDLYKKIWWGGYPKIIVTGTGIKNKYFEDNIRIEIAANAEEQACAWYSRLQVIPVN